MKILIVASFPDSLIRFRGDMIKELILKNFDVLAAAPSIDTETKNKLIALGATPIEYSLQRKGMNPFKDIGTIRSLKKIIKINGVDLVIPYTIKPVVYSSIAANRLKVPVISLITGLGFTFSATSVKAKVLEQVTTLLYRLAVRSNNIVIFQNKDDHKLFVKKGILKECHPFTIVSGSGVNLDHFPQKSYLEKKQHSRMVFIFVGRLIREKGINIFVNTAKTLKVKYPNAEFHILGGHDGSESSISLKELYELDKKKIIKFHGSQKSVIRFLQDSDVFVLPTFYREGIPRSILEAMSIGLPIVTTDSPGCRETVLKGDGNGFLIAKENQDELTLTLEKFLLNPDWAQKKGKSSRLYAQQRFDVRLINQEIIKTIKKII